jgi:prepilin-type N-terminal cleavage/methylation domain-containing protein
MNRNKKRVSKGFTLLEILLVIATIGILAAIVLVAINPNRQINQARQAAINSDRNTIEKALQQALIDTGSYPVGLDGVQKKVCSNTVNTPGCVDLRSLIPDYIAAIPSSTTYTVARGNDGRVYVNTTETQVNLSCPTGYIKVPGNSLYQTKDFCVMKYEAKAVEISNPTVGLTTPTTGFNTIANNTTATTAANGRAIASVASGYPIANISQTTAAQYCTDAGASLINNREWMTIARNIEAQNSNWYNPTPTPVNQVGSGGLWRGHSDASPNNALAASTNDNLGYEGTGNDINNGWQEKRTHTLSNG